MLSPGLPDPLSHTNIPTNQTQLFGRSRRKAALMSGKALVELNEYGAAIAILEAAKQVRSYGHTTVYDACVLCLLFPRGLTAREVCCAPHHAFAH